MATDMTTTKTSTPLPEIVSQEEWDRARAALLLKEKAHMKANDALSAERRRLPAVEITKPYLFDSAEGKVSLLDLFEGRSQLLVYNFMFAPDWDEGCVGCSMLVDHMGPVAHLQARDVSRVLVSRAPLPKLLAYKERMGWSERWVSSWESDFNYDFGGTTDEGEDGKLNVFLRDGERIFRTYDVTNRGTEPLVSVFRYLDATPYGRQEQWEDAPEGWPKMEPNFWWQRHDAYEHAKASGGGCH
jgi:predicted dithiol-disulfide oxidoreductase (DUF899 family)